MKGKNLRYENWRLLDICRVLNVLWIGDPEEIKYRKKESIIKRNQTKRKKRREN